MKIIKSINIFNQSLCKRGLIYFQFFKHLLSSLLISFEAITSKPEPFVSEPVSDIDFRC